jgi:hypothetical protein
VVKFGFDQFGMAFANHGRHNFRKENIALPFIVIFFRHWFRFLESQAATDIPNYFVSNNYSISSKALRCTIELTSPAQGAEMWLGRTSIEWKVGCFQVS